MDVREYLTADGKNPYRHAGRYATGPHSGEVLRFSTGNLGDHKSVAAASGKRGSCSDRVSDLLRQGRAQLVLLLLGGNKSTQTADVVRAQESWKAYQEGKRRGKTK